MAKRRKPKARPSPPSRRPLPVPRQRAARRTAEPLDLDRCERFLLHEARLLDDGKFDDWLALFTPDAWYWVPSEPDQDNPHDTVSLIYDDRRLLETRVRRLASPRIYSQEPRLVQQEALAAIKIERLGDATRGALTRHQQRAPAGRRGPRLGLASFRHGARARQEAARTGAACPLVMRPSQASSMLRI